jgi:hypothetical protein
MATKRRDPGVATGAGVQTDEDRTAYSTRQGAQMATRRGKSPIHSIHLAALDSPIQFLLIAAFWGIIIATAVAEVLRS